MLRTLRAPAANVEEELQEIVRVCREDAAVRSQGENTVGDTTPLCYAVQWCRYGDCWAAGPAA